MKFQKLLSVVFVLLTSTLFFQAQAQYPVVIPYQGTIADTGGTPYDGTFDFKFELKDKFGAVKWSSGIISLDVNLGAYSVDLGATPQPAIWDTCFKQDSLELFTSFDDGTNGMETLLPSVRLKPVPYSVHSRFADVYCGDTLHTKYIHSYWIHGYWFWGYWAVFDSIYVKKVVVDSLYVKHLFMDTIIVDIICTKKIKLDDPVTGENTTIEPDGVVTAKKDSVTKEVDVTGVFPEGIVVARLDSTGKVLDSTIISATGIKTKLICADSIKVEDPANGTVTGMSARGMAIKDTNGRSTVIKQDSSGKTCIENSDAGPPESKAGIKLDGENGDVCIQGNFKVQLPNGNTVFISDDGIFVTDTASNTTWIMVEFDPSTGQIRIPGDATLSGNNVNKGTLEVCGDLILKGNIVDTAGNPILTYDAATGSVTGLGNIQLPVGPPPPSPTGNYLVFDQFGNGQWQPVCPCGPITFDTDASIAPGKGAAQNLGIVQAQNLMVQLDHPLDPKNKVLTQSAITSPELLNVYNGNITTNAQGEAVVEMPAYVEASNTDFRYQLTVIGSFAQAIVFKEMNNNQFVIKTDQPGVKVSWQLSGVRTDAYARENPVEAEKAKSTADKGTLLYTPTGKVATK